MVHAHERLVGFRSQKGQVEHFIVTSPDAEMIQAFVEHNDRPSPIVVPRTRPRSASLEEALRAATTESTTRNERAAIVLEWARAHGVAAEVLTFHIG